MKKRQNPPEPPFDRRITLADLSDEFLVRCPTCFGWAVVRPQPNPPEPIAGRRVRLTCGHCGSSRERSQDWQCINGAIDPYFQLPLWLQRPCCGHVLWAYNRSHLDFLAAYVAAKLRGGWGLTPSPAAPRNRTLASRLPRWLQSAHHREDILHGIGELRRLLP